MWDLVLFPVFCVLEYRISCPSKLFRQEQRCQSAVCPCSSNALAILWTNRRFPVTTVCVTTHRLVLLQLGGKLTAENPHQMDFYWEAVFPFTKVFLLFPVFRMRNSKPAVAGLAVIGPKQSDSKWHPQRSLFLLAESRGALDPSSNFFTCLPGLPTGNRHQSRC